MRRFAVGLALHRFRGEGREQAKIDVHWLKRFRLRAARNMAEQRAERLASASPDDNRITHGCINVSPGFYEQVIRPTFERGGVFYILPDTASLEETFPDFVQSRATSKRSGGKRARSARQ